MSTKYPGAEQVKGIFDMSGTGDVGGPTESATIVDARVFGGMFTICEFRGNEFDPEKKRKCKHYFKSYARDCCGHYRDDTEIGACDCGKGA